MLQPENPGPDYVFGELDNATLTDILKERDRVIRELQVREMQPELKEIWTALTRLRDRVDNLEQLISRHASHHFEVTHELGNLIADLKIRLDEMVQE